MAGMSASQIAAELQRKRNNGITPTSTANMAAYNKLTPQTPTPKVAGVSAQTAQNVPQSKGAIPSFAPAKINAATGAQSSSLGYGGATYGADKATNAAITANEQMIRNTPGFKDTEITRSQGVISSLESALKTDPGNADLQKRLTDANKYLNVNLGYAAQKPAVNMPQYAPSSGDAVTNVRNSSDLQQQAQDATAQERAALLNAINTQMQSLKNNADYSNQLIQDNRVLEDQALLRNKNPFSGGTDYQLAQVQRGRSIDDSARGAQLTNTLNSLSTEIANFDKLTPERQRTIYNQLLELERNFGLNVGQLTGNYGNGRTLQGAAQDWGQQMDLTDRLGYFPNGGSTPGANGSANSAGMSALGGLSGVRTLAGQQMDLANRQANWDAAQSVWDATGKLVNPQSDWSGLIRQAQNGNTPKTFQAQQQEWQNNFNSEQFSWQKAQQTYENTFKERSFEQDMKEAAASRGLQWASLNQRDKEFIADQAFREKQFEFEQKQFDAKQTGDYTTNPSFVEDITWINSNPEKAVAEIRSQSQALIQQYGYEGYETLLKAAQTAAEE